MRFTPYILKDRRAWTARRIAAARRAAQRERDAVPLFPELARYRTTEERMAVVNKEEDAWLASCRDFRAAQWRKARRLLAGMPETRRRGFLALWNRGIYPAEPCYLLDVIHGLRHESPWTKLRELHQLPAAGRRWREANNWRVA